MAPLHYAYVGVDPGFTGAIGLIETVMGEPLASVYDMPIRTVGGRPRIDRSKVVLIFREFLIPGRRLIVVVEAVSAMAKQGRKEGTASMFRFGQGQGEILGILTALDAIVLEVPAAIWKAKAGLIGVDDRGVCKRAADLGLAPRSVLFGPRGGPLHGRADALFLADHARRMGQNLRRGSS